tara:strand:- start:617 stop:1492 length:876 start_codon:yes stop_codon:yes gene_type:complete
MIKKAAFFSFYKLFSVFSLTFLHFLGKIIGNAMFFLPTKAKKVTKTNISNCFPIESNIFIKDLVRDSLIETSKTLIETPKIWSLNKKGINLKFEVVNEESLLASIKKNKGVILFTPHLGNVEVMINYLGQKFNPVIPYKVSDNAVLDKFVKSSRESAGAKMVPASISGVRTVLKELQKSGFISIASDQVPTNKKNGLISNFFGVPSLTTTLVHSLASKVDCPVHVITCIRKKGGLFKILFSNELKDFSKLSSQEGVDIMNKELENCIMKAPEQYAWEYKKFKHSNPFDPYS